MRLVWVFLQGGSGEKRINLTLDTKSKYEARRSAAGGANPTNLVASPCGPLCQCLRKPFSVRNILHHGHLLFLYIFSLIHLRYRDFLVGEQAGHTSVSFRLDDTIQPFSFNCGGG